MKKAIILSAVFIIMMAAAIAGYQTLSSDYDGDNYGKGNNLTTDAADVMETENETTESGAAKDETEESGTVEKETAESDTAKNETEESGTIEGDTAGDDTAKNETEESGTIEDEMPESGTAEDEAADFAVRDWDGNQVNLSDFYGKPIVVNFWATWCGPCKSELPVFDNAYAAYQDEITFLMVNMTDGFSETEEGTKRFVEENGYSFPVYFDTSQEAYRAYWVTAIPMTVFIGADGKLIGSELGAMTESTFTSYLKEYYGVE